MLAGFDMEWLIYVVAGAAAVLAFYVVWLIYMLAGIKW